MLILSREPDADIIIGDGPDAVRVVIVSVVGGVVRVGIDAPPGTLVVRGELPPDAVEELRRRAKVKAAKLAAATTPTECA